MCTPGRSQAFSRSSEEEQPPDHHLVERDAEGPQVAGERCPRHTALPEKLRSVEARRSPDSLQALLSTILAPVRLLAGLAVADVAIPALIVRVQDYASAKISDFYLRRDACDGVVATELGRGEIIVHECMLFDTLTSTDRTLSGLGEPGAPPPDFYTALLYRSRCKVGRLTPVTRIATGARNQARKLECVSLSVPPYAGSWYSTMPVKSTGSQRHNTETTTVCGS